VSGTVLRLNAGQYFLKHLSPADVTQQYLGWLHDPEVTRFLEVRFQTPSTVDDQKSWVATFDQKNSFLFGIYPNDTATLIGTITLYALDVRNKHARYGFLVGEKDYWGRAVPAQVIPALLDFAFTELKLHKVCGSVDIRNVQSVVIHRKLGFRNEGVFKQHIHDSGRFFDQINYAIFASDWRQPKKT